MKRRLKKASEIFSLPLPSLSADSSRKEKKERERERERTAGEREVRRRSLLALHFSLSQVEVSKLKIGKW